MTTATTQYIDSRGCPTRDFLLAGSATFTIETPDRHYTYQVSHSEANENWPAAYWVSVLSGPDNTGSYTSLGKLNPETGDIRLNRKCTYKDDTFLVRLLTRVLARIWQDDTAPIFEAGYRVMHAGKCCRCGRTLTTPESVDAGIGPICAQL